MYVCVEEEVEEEGEGRSSGGKGARKVTRQK